MHGGGEGIGASGSSHYRMTKGWEDDEEEKEDVEERRGILISFSDRPDIEAISWKWHKREDAFTSLVRRRSCRSRGVRSIRRSVKYPTTSSIGKSPSNSEKSERRPAARANSFTTATVSQSNDRPQPRCKIQ